MGDFRRDNRGGGRSFGRSNFSGGKSFDRRPEMHKAICSNCGKECELPFKPTGDRPVYCRDCFATHGGGDERRNDRRDERSEGRDDRPPFRRFEDRPTHTSPPAVAYEKKFDDINFKLDQILKLLNPNQKEPQQFKEPKVEKAQEVKKAPVPNDVKSPEKQNAKQNVEENLGVVIKKRVKKTPVPPIESLSEDALE